MTYAVPANIFEPNGALVIVVYHSRNADTAAFRQISAYYKKLCTKFGQLVLRKIIEIVATRYHILRLKMHQIQITNQLVASQTSIGSLFI